MKEEIKDTFEHAIYFGYRLDLFRVESNCPVFLNTGKSPKKLLGVDVEWCETYIYYSVDRVEYDERRLEKTYKNPAHARSLALGLVMGHVTSRDLDDYCVCEGDDDLEKMVCNKDLIKVAFGAFADRHDYPSNGMYRLIMTYRFDYSDDAVQA
jgi:hypothetical protein